MPVTSWAARKDTALSRTGLLQWMTPLQLRTSVRPRKPCQENIRHRSLAYRNDLADTAIVTFTVFPTFFQVWTCLSISWRVAYVIPIHQNGPTTDPSKHRPISPFFFFFRKTWMLSLVEFIFSWPFTGPYSRRALVSARYPLFSRILSNSMETLQYQTSIGLLSTFHQLMIRSIEAWLDTSPFVHVFNIDLSLGTEISMRSREMESLPRTTLEVHHLPIWTICWVPKIVPTGWQDNMLRLSFILCTINLAIRWEWY